MTGLARLLPLTLVLIAFVAAQAADLRIMTYQGHCDASAASSLDAMHFVVGNDEGDTLYVYRRGDKAAVNSVDLSSFLRTKRGEESDIEGAAAIGQRIYWITSHGRNSKGKFQPSRHRFFATDVVGGQPPGVVPVGEPYANLLRDMEKAENLKTYKLREAARLPAEAKGGLNIEGLAATPEGTLLIGFRNPLPHQQALIIPLLNPAELIAGKTGRFGTPVELDLGRRGIRSIEQFGTGYLIVAGPTADIGDFALFSWSGRASDKANPLAGVALKDLRPEALFSVTEGKEAQLLSDDGGIVIRGMECKKLPIGDQVFRGLNISP